MAGLGAAMFTGEVGPGDSVAVFGCGGVGCAAVAGSKLAGAAVIIAVDLDPGKLELATQFGATHTVDAGATDPVEAIKALTGGNGADVCIEAVGHPKVMEQAFFARDLAGTLVQVGVPTPDMRIDLPMIEFFGRGGALKPSWYGDCLPSRDFPMLVDLYLDGRLDLDRFVSETIGSATSRRRSTACSAARCCAPSSSCEPPARSLRAAAGERAAWSRRPTSWPRSPGSARWPTVARPPTPRWRPAPPWPWSARTCAASAATSSPWCRRRARTPEALLSIGRAGAGSDAARAARRGPWRRCHCAATSAACRCPAPSTAGWPSTSATAACRWSGS